MNMSMILKIFGESILAALTGGFYIDSSQSHFINIVHIYLYIGLFLSPLLIALTAPSSYFGWVIYCLIAGLTILIIKLITHRLHYLFDTSDAIVDDTANSDTAGITMASTSDEEPGYRMARLDVEACAANVSNEAICDEPSPMFTSSRRQLPRTRARGPSIPPRPGASASGPAPALPPRNEASGGGQTSGLTFEETRGKRKYSLPAQTRHGVAQQTPAGVSLAPAVVAVSGRTGVGLHRTSSRSAADYCQQLEALRRDVSKLSIKYDDFEPSTADLELLDANPTSRNLVKSISRSRSNSQRRRPSLRSVSTRGAGGSGTGLVVGHGEAGQGRTVARSQSLRQAVVVARRIQQLPGRRTQSFRRDESGGPSNRRYPSQLAMRCPSGNVISGGESIGIPGGPSHASSSGGLGGKGTLEEEPGEQPTNGNAAAREDSTAHVEVRVPKASLSEVRLSSEDGEYSETEESDVQKVVTQATVEPTPNGDSSSESVHSVVSIHRWMFKGSQDSEEADVEEKVPEGPAVEGDLTATDKKGPTRRKPRKAPGNQSNNPTGDESGDAKEARARQSSSESATCETSSLLPASQADIASSTEGAANQPEIKRLIRQSCIRRRRRGSVGAPRPSDPSLGIEAVQEVWQERPTGASNAPPETRVPTDDEGAELAPHDDTSEGSVHFFLDENGRWMVYVFGDGTGAAFTRREWLERVKMRQAIQEDTVRVSEIDDSLVRYRPGAPNPEEPDVWPWPYVTDSLVRMRRAHGARSSALRNARLINSQDLEDLETDRNAEESREPTVPGPESEDEDEIYDRQMARTLTWDDRTASLDPPLLDWFVSDRYSGVGIPRSTSQPRKKHFYRLKLIPWQDKLYKVRFDRLQLSALFDRSLSTYEIVISVMLGMLVAYLGCFVISKGVYQDFLLLTFCATIAGCQYCLIKSVQPDASSPQHGFNRIILFSRATYFCVVSVCFLVVNACVEALEAGGADADMVPGRLYGFPVIGMGPLLMVRSALKYLLVGLPFLFMMGLLPQVNTGLAYFLEQVDIHVFGASGTTGVASGLFSLARNILAIGLSYGLCYGGIKGGDPQHVVFSVFWGVHLALCYFLSRLPSNVALYRELCPSTTPKAATDKQPCSTSGSCPDPIDAISFPIRSCPDPDSMKDPLPQAIRKSLLARLKNDAAVCLVVAILGFAVHVSTAFSSPALQPHLQWVAIFIAVAWGASLHYVWPHLRKPYPWLLLAKPLIRPDPNGELLTTEAIYIWLLWIERNILVPLVTMASVTQSVVPLLKKFGTVGATFVIIVTSMKMLRNGYAGTSRVFAALFFTYLLFGHDFKHLSETFPVDYFLTAILLAKVMELLLKLQFVYVYIAPWQISWGSAFHAFAQLSFVPHSMFLTAQCVFSSLVSSPLEPFLASAIFLSSYVRPIKFWEEDYKTNRAETTNLSMAAQVEGRCETVSENLNAIFYEHLTRSLQKCLAGDILLGRWGNVTHGDIFILASEDLHFLVHIIELGNGLVTFQLRGLEFVGTYCHEQETEELRTDIHNDDGFCCCYPGHIPHLLSLNALCHQRWVAWEFVNTPYFLDGYRITDHSASTSLQLFDLRKLVILFYVQCIIYYTVKLPSLLNYLRRLELTLEKFESSSFVDLDPIFNKSLDDDYDDEVSGVSKKKFVEVHLPWIQYCVQQREDGEEIPCDADSPLISLCLGLSLLGRRCLGGVYPEKYAHQLDSFLHGLHSVFKGDIRVMTKDDWVFEEIDLLKTVIAPAVRIAVKLYQDQFACASLSIKSDLYQAIDQTEKSFVICHETHPMWRFAVLNDAESLFSFRRVCRVANDGYRIIMLSKKKLQFRVVKINSECVRGLWAGQQQEQIFLRNNDVERGSIQHARQVLRNLINSSCDLPIGYPIFISPLTTSFAGTHPVYSRIAGQEFSVSRALGWLRQVWNQLRWRCRETCVPPSGRIPSEAIEMTTFSRSGVCSPSPGHLGGGPVVAGVSGLGVAGGPGGKGKPTVTLSALIHQQQVVGGGGAEQTTEGVASGGQAVGPPTTNRVKITDTNQILNDKHNKLNWPTDEWKTRAVTVHTSPVPLAGQEGTLVHRWTPCNPDMTCRSFCHRSIAMVRLSGLLGPEEKLVLVYEEGIQTLESTAADVQSPSVV